MSKEFVIECRYQYRSNYGIEWTNWFVCDNEHRNEDDSKVKIKELKESSKVTDTKTKLKHEYRVLDADIYENSHQEFLKRVEVAKKDFATIKRIKKPWAKEARKERKKLMEMSNIEKVLYRAKKNTEAGL